MRKDASVGAAFLPIFCDPAPAFGVIRWDAVPERPKSWLTVARRTQLVVSPRMVSSAAVAHRAPHRTIIADLNQERSPNLEAGFVRLLRNSRSEWLFAKRELQFVTDRRPCAGERSGS